MMKQITLITCLLLLISFLDNKELISQNQILADKLVSQAVIDSTKKYALTYPNETQFSIAVIQHDTVSYLGIKKIDGELIFISNKDSLFEIGSITKIFTSTILVDLILKGQINPDEPISQSLPFKLKESEKDGKAITCKMLSNHTSGIPSFPDSIDEYIKINPENPFVDFDKGKFERYLMTDMKLNFTPGTQYDYSNMGAVLLGYLIEIKTGKLFDSLLQSIVFSKYHMRSTTITKETSKNPIVKGHNETGKPVLNYDWNAMCYAGACLSSANDLAQFVLANFTNDSILEYQRQRTFSVENNDLGLAYAWHIYHKNGIEWYFHNGGTGGYCSNITMDLEKKCAIIVLVNCNYEPEARYLEKISWKILKTIRE
jgi:CubicO group peptidase (beta-lactamase class C family)